MSRFGRWFNSKRGKHTVAGILMLVLVIIILGQLANWWGDLIPGPGTVIVPAPVEITKSTEITSKDALGSLSVDYPQHLTPKASDTIVVSISSLQLLASADLKGVARVEIAEDTPVTLGKAEKFEATILIQDELRLLLTSPTLSTESLYPEIQTVMLDQPNVPTIWAWSIIAPDTPGFHTLNLRIYVPDKEEAPVWAGVFQVEVVLPETVTHKTGLLRAIGWLSPGIIVFFCLLLICVCCFYGAIRLYAYFRNKQLGYKPGNEELRKKFNRLDDADLNALCLDHFPKVYDKFSSGTRRDEKINILLEYCWRSDRANNNKTEIRRLAALLDIFI